MTDDSMTPAARRLFTGQRSNLLPVFEQVYRACVDRYGCSVNVKTVYVSFVRDRQMFAAVHPGTGYFEIALPSSVEVDQRTYEAPHLKWPMLPRGVCVYGNTEVDAACDLLERVSRALDDVKK